MQQDYQQLNKNTVTVSQQIKVIFFKNFKVSFRAKDYIGELAFPILGIIFVIINNNVGKNVADGENTLDIATLELSFFSVWLLGLSVMGLLRTFIFNFVNEKGERYKETQKIMGLYSSSYQFGWLSSTFTKGFVIGLIYIGSLGIAKGFEGVYNTAYGWIFLSYFLYIISSIAQTYFFSSLFQKGKTAMDVTFLIQIIASFLYNLAGIDAIYTSSIAMYLISIFPQTALQMGLFCRGWNGTEYTMYGQFCLKYPPQKLPDGTVIPNINPPNSDFTFSVQDSCIILSITSVIYFLMYFYFDQTMKNEYGTQKPHFWFLRGSKKTQNLNDNTINQGLLQNEQNNANDLDASSAQYHEKLDPNFNLKPTVFIKNLVKQFYSFRAVDDLTLTLYEKQIFCLLGHNGAGKTTTISLLTGLIEKNNGQVSINGLNLDDNLDTIRQTFGLCLQKDVLYDNLTVEEHLLFIGQIKGIDANELQEDMVNVIQKCGLQLEKSKKVQELSGGNKRKLSLAMALIGKSKIIFLDEPSSGMDPNSRRVIWKILEEVRAEEDRTIVLTTHHMEEAEHLADRIGIMTHGKLLTIGTSNFIKKTFGIGYHLKINAKTNHNLQVKQDIDINSGDVQLSQDKIENLKNIVVQYVPNAKHNQQSPQGTLIYTLPFDQRAQFIELFKVLESDKSIEINLEMNSLEDAFINIGMEKNDENQENSVAQNNEYSDFSDIVAPQSLQNPPTYKFFTQFMPIFSRKLYLTLRSISVVIGFLLPITFQFFGVVLAWLVYSVFSDNDTDDQDQDLGGATFWQAMMVSGYNVLAYLFNSSTYCGTVAQERDDKIKYQLNVMGLKNVPYWLGTFCFDYLMYLTTVVFFIVLCYIFGITGITTNLGGLILTFLLFGFAFIWQNYACNFLFKKGASAFKFIIIVNYAFFYLIPLMIAFIVKKPLIISQIFALISPYTCFQFAFYSIIPDDEIPQTFQDFSFKPFNELYPYWLALAAQALIAFSVTIYIDRRNAIMVDKQDVSPTEINENEITDEFIKQEENRILDINCRDTVKTKNLFKKYENGYLALKNTSLSVNEGEIFGLLGPNGAGKSTTFNILTSLIPKTRGSVEMQGQQITSGIMDIYQHVGITPQFDPLWENLTVKEHLEIYGKVKGLSGQILVEQMNYYMQVMQLTNYTNVRSKQLSGGNKRKLCVTIALIGGSSIQFFDEPSTGVDPIARRFLWNTLQQSLKLRNSSIVLTTHSMHEAESLCTKIGIQINGRFQCIGTPQELKKRYGGGYNINIQLNDDTMEEQRINLTNNITKEFPFAKNMTNETTQDKSLLFQIPYEKFSFYETYKFFMRDQINSQFKDFGISQSSLEQIFLYFSSFQKSAEEAEAEAQLQQDVKNQRPISYQNQPQMA